MHSSPYRGQRLGAGLPQLRWSLVAEEGILAAVEQEDNSAVEEGSPAAAVVGIQVVAEVDSWRDNMQVVALGNHLQPAAARCSFAAAEKWEREGSFAAGDQVGNSLVAVAVGSSD